MRRSDFHFDLPPELIAQRPVEPRSASRMLLLEGATGSVSDRVFRDLPSLLSPRDLLVLNDTRVLPARAHGVKESGGRIEILLERVQDDHTALVQARSSKPLRPGGLIRLAGGHQARMLGKEEGLTRLEFSGDVLAFFESHGSMPLPPYIARQAEDADCERYQTVYARAPGAVAAPTAGLHFDAQIFAALAARGIRHEFVTLHVGAGTFQPMRVEDIDAHRMHPEYARVPARTCAAIREARAAGGRVVAVGTTVVRSLESAATGGQPAPFEGETRIFIRPGHRFRSVDAMLTNFHLPQSTLVMLCAAFAGREALLRAYAHAVRARYRFFSYGDAMFITPAAAVPERT
ncbi:MAG: tRNA preQ1(34) S-adenosylmethionine ribosyltransferase-isomerase QueA [Steroidobacteraceae bacterium]|jgi:S-adenosylmethionine:tRNA ribosyltransferase-isomerase